MSLKESLSPRSPDRWTLIRDAAVLQFKLVVDGFRDLLLVPASLLAAVVSLLDNHDGKPGPQFYRLLALGKQSERAINLFGAFDNSPPGVREEFDFGEMNIDDLVVKVESFVVDEYRKGGLTKQAKSRIDKAIDAMQKAAREKPAEEKPPT
jgi:hypothetical protein